ncbi:MAG: sensor histidine kinase, partial [Polyangiales bacterium]
MESALPPKSVASVPLPPEVSVSTPGAVIVVDESGRLRDRSPAAQEDAELASFSIGELVPGAILASADARRFVHEGSNLDALWFGRGANAITGGLGERDFGAMLLRLRNLVGIVVASLETEEMMGGGPASTQINSTRRREVDRLVDALAGLGHGFGPAFARSFVDLELVLRRTLDVTRGNAKRRGVTLRLEGARDARRGRTGDEALLQAAVQALVANALDASPEGGEVRIKVEAGPASVSIAIEDDGPGLLAP